MQKGFSISSKDIRVDVTVLAALEGHRRHIHDVLAWKARYSDESACTYRQRGSRVIAFTILNVTEEHCYDTYITLACLA